MANITTCTSCGKAYEAGSEEQANERVRACPDCTHRTHVERRGDQDFYAWCSARRCMWTSGKRKSEGELDSVRTIHERAGAQG